MGSELVPDDQQQDSVSRTHVPWPSCQGDSDCAGSALSPWDRCLAHLAPDNLEQAIKRAKIKGLDARGVTVAPPLLKRIFSLLDKTDQDLPIVPIAWFDQATFTGDAWFGRVIFTGPARFARATFTGPAWFVEATFTGDAWFDRATFSKDAWFHLATFSKDAWFHRATFSKDAGFIEAIFTGPAEFTRATFTGPAQFAGATFTENAVFHRATFTENAVFIRATFTGLAEFTGAATFGKDAWFAEATFSKDAWFAEAIFTGPAAFAEAIFTGPARFTRATFTGPAWFDQAIFTENAVFDAVSLSGGLSFLRVRAAKRLQLALRDGSIGEIDLTEASFAGPAILTASLWWGSIRRPRLVSLVQADTTNLTVAGLDLSNCRFLGAINLERLRIDGPLLLDEARGWWRARRQVLWEEGELRGWPGWATPDRQDGPEVDPHRGERASRLQTVYRELRKGREDAKDEPGAADFYYGEMEMRRKAAGGVERWLLTAYWAVSGYGLRASRAILALLVLLAGATVGFHAIGSHPQRGWRDVALYAVYTSTSLLRPTAAMLLTRWGQFIEITLRLLVPVLLSLAILAVRGRIKR